MGSRISWLRSVTVLAICQLALGCGDDADSAVDAGLVIDARAGDDSGATDGAAVPDATLASLSVDPEVADFGSATVGGWVEGCPPSPTVTLVVRNLVHPRPR